MKKWLLILPLVLILTGCTNYSNVADYSVAMQQVRKNKPAYNIEASLKAANGNSKYYKAYIKGDKWKVFESQDNGKTFIKDTMLYDGKHVYGYSDDKKMAVIMDFDNALPGLFSSSEESKEMMNLMAKFMNPMYILFDWHLDIDNPQVSNCKMWKFSGINYKNNHFCRSIKYNDQFELCVSDKYGISVYSKIKSKKNGEVEFNVKKIKTSYISNSEFELPAGTEVQSLSNMFNQLKEVMGTDDM